MSRVVLRAVAGVIIAGVAVAIVPATGVRAAQSGANAAVASTQVDYNWDVRPILSDNCFRCHGPDEKSRQARLRLDTPDGAYAALARGEHAIVPGSPDQSEMIRRVSATTAAVRMPPASTNKTLTTEQIETLRAWIAQGATYKPHWAFITPTMPPVPQATTTPVASSPIDRFVASRLEREGLQLSPEADRETLINRVSLTLTGLPPTLAHVDAFVNDHSPNAYEKVVDRLLASPAYGERMAEYWLDLARYSESDGYLDDLHDRLFWPYRDWVIAAFNHDMPFDQFGTWQIAGDLLPSRTAQERREHRLATAFLRLNQRTTENGAIDEEYRVEYMLDRANTIGNGFLGLTVGCARCHDHKYDPIAQKDYYALAAFFNSADEPGYYAPGYTGVTPGPTLDWTDAATDRKLAAANEAIRRAQLAFDAARASATRAAAVKVDVLLTHPDDLRDLLQQSIGRGLVAYYPFEQTLPIPDDKLPASRPRDVRPAPGLLASETVPPTRAPVPASLAAARRLPSDLVRDALAWSPAADPGDAPPAVLESAQLKPGVKGNAFWFDDTNRGFFGDNVGMFERTQPFSIDFWLFAPKVYEDSMILNNRENDYVGDAGYQLDLEQNHLRFDLMHSRAGNRIVVLTKAAIPLNQWVHVTATYDGSSRANGAALYIDGQRAAVDVISDNLNRSMRVNGGGTLGDEYLGLQFGKRFRMTAVVGGALDEVRIFKTALTPLEIEYLQQQTTGKEDLSSGHDLRSHVIEAVVAGDSQVIAAARSLHDAREAQNQIISRVHEVPVMGDTPTPRQAYVLVRGVYTNHGDPVSPRGLSQVFPWNDAWPQNRLGLAKWLFDPANPLTARVFVNRLWQMQFGRGLVETAEDFGTQGAIPANPELLDWLAVTFRDSGWDVKALVRRMVLSATYRQSSNASETLMKKDPRNILLARFSRARMPAEVVRDNALAAAGLLVPRVGGPSVYPYEPDGVWTGFNSYVYPEADKVPADENHRRTMYSFVKRNAPDPSLAAFDMPDRTLSVARRQTSSTPLQPLVLLNDPQYVEAYRALASRVMTTTAGADAQITQVFRLATRRRPRPEEMAPMRAYYDHEVERYAQDRAAAAALLKVGVTPADQTLDVVRLAALTNVAAAVMNTPDAYSIH